MSNYWSGKGAAVLGRAENVLFVGAHPDDIEFYCSGTVQLMHSQGSNISYLILTKGDHGLSGFLGTWIRGKRVTDQHKAAKLLGVGNVTLLDYPDGDLSSHIEAMADDVAKVAAKVRPDLVLCWDPYDTYNPHADHISSGAAVVGSHISYPLGFYGTTKPDTFAKIEVSALKTKLAAIRCHSTETPLPYYWIQKRSVIARMKACGSLAGCELAECFKLDTVKTDE